VGKMNNQFRNDEIVKVNGKDYPVVGGRLRLAHDENEKSLSIETTVIKYEDGIAVIQAKVTTEKGIYNGLGNATVQRDARLKMAILELAETRAIARALRFAGYGVEYTGFEEVDYGEHEDKPQKNAGEKKMDKPQGNQEKQQTAGLCDKCRKPITAAEKGYSEKKYGIPLCRECQKTIPV
jgi:hypothetical protein